MLALLGFSMIIIFIYLIMTKKMSALVALILVPLGIAAIGGYGDVVGVMMLEGIRTIAPTCAMLLFAILYFGIMIDTGLFDPIIKKIINAVQGDPVRISMGTAILSLLVALDGDGTTTYMITVSALLPLYIRLGMNPLVLATISMLSLGIMSGMTPWGGPATRAISSLGLDASDYFIPLIPTLIGGAAWVLFTAYILGKKERKKVGVVDIRDDRPFQALKELSAANQMKRPHLIWINLLLTIFLMIGLVIGIWPISILFMVAFAIALMINYPKLEDQKERISSHAGNALAVVSLVFAAGIFTGIISGTRMVDAMALTLVSFIPECLGSYLPVIVAITSLPFTFILSNDAYYFGVLPILAEAAESYGIDAMEIGRASILGQPVHLLSPLVASTYLLVGMVGVDIGEYQRFAIKWAALTSIAIIVIAVITGAIS